MTDLSRKPACLSCPIAIPQYLSPFVALLHCPICSRTWLSSLARRSTFSTGFIVRVCLRFIPPATRSASPRAPRPGNCWPAERPLLATRPTRPHLRHGNGKLHRYSQSYERGAASFSISFWDHRRYLRYYHRGSHGNSSDFTFLD